MYLVDVASGKKSLVGYSKILFLFQVGKKVLGGYSQILLLCRVEFKMSIYVPIFMGTCHHFAMTCPDSTVDIQANNGQG